MDIMIKDILIKSKRHRRTKAEMQAAREAEAKSAAPKARKKVKDTKEISDKAWKLIDYICCHTKDTVVVFKNGNIKSYADLEAVCLDLNEGEMPDDAVDVNNCEFVTDTIPANDKRYKRRRENESVQADRLAEEEKKVDEAEPKEPCEAAECV